MSDIDWNTLALEESKRIQKDLANAIKSFRKRRFQEARVAAEATARGFGYSLADPTGNSGSATKTVDLPKYRHPDNPEMT